MVNETRELNLRLRHDRKKLLETKANERAQLLTQSETFTIGECALVSDTS